MEADPSLIVERFSTGLMATATSNRNCGLSGERRRQEQKDCDRDQHNDQEVA